MANEIQIFKNEKFGEVRVTMNEREEPMFCLADVCKALELKNPSDVKTRLSSNGVALFFFRISAFTFQLLINIRQESVARYSVVKSSNSI